MSQNPSAKTGSAPEEDVSQERVISPSLRRQLQQCYEHGTKLMEQEKYDYDYAHSILVECVVKDPGNSVYLDVFFENLHRKYDNNKRGSRLSFGGKGPFKKSLAKKDWAAVLKLGPAVLKSNPWDVPTLRGMAEACAALGYNDAELRYLKNALEARPKDPEVNRHCALSLTRMGQYDQAIACWHRVDEAKNGDEEAQKMMSELQITKTQQRMGLGKDERRTGGAKGRAMETRPARPSQAEADEDVQPAGEPAKRREIPLTRRQQLEQAVALNPADTDSYFELAQLHVDEDRLGEAAHVLHKALAASGNDIKVQERWEDVEILRKKQQLAVAEKRAATEPTDQGKELVRQLRGDLNRYELEVYDRRSQRYPSDLEWKFQLGLRLKRADNFREAIKCFQQAQKLPERRAGASLELGECLQRLKQYGKALQCYQRALEGVSEEQLDLRKLALYRAGLLAAGLRNWESAEEHLGELVALDAAYKDAATRLDKIRQIRHKG